MLSFPVRRSGQPKGDKSITVHRRCTHTFCIISWLALLELSRRLVAFELTFPGIAVLGISSPRGVI